MLCPSGFTSFAINDGKISSAEEVTCLKLGSKLAVPSSIFKPLLLTELKNDVGSEPNLPVKTLKPESIPEEVASILVLAKKSVLLAKAIFTLVKALSASATALMP